MSTSPTDLPRHDGPTPDDLAGVPLGKEEENAPPVRGRGSSGVRTRGAAGLSPQSPRSLPTADDLAGIPVSAEADEDLTVRVRTPHPPR